MNYSIKVIISIFKAKSKSINTFLISVPSYPSINKNNLKNFQDRYRNIGNVFCSEIFYLNSAQNYKASTIGKYSRSFIIYIKFNQLVNQYW